MRDVRGREWCRQSKGVAPIARKEVVPTVERESCVGFCLLEGGAVSAVGRMNSAGGR